VLRLVEIALFLAPFAAFFVWRAALPRGGPSRLTVGIGVAIVLALAAMLGWLSGEDTLPPGAQYIPPHVENGVIVPGRGVPK
jgi:hypothetical protein